MSEDEKKIAYLQMIQEPICRMSTISAIFKGFAATIVSGIAALTYCGLNTVVLGLSFLPVFMFAILDIYYLYLEKEFRKLFIQVANGEHEINFKIGFIEYESKKVKRKEQFKTIIKCLKSPSIYLFYPVLLAVLIVVFGLKCGGVI